MAGLGKYNSRKFILTVWAMVLITIALFLNKISGGIWVTALSTVLAMYKTSEVMDKHLNGNGQDQ